MSSQRQRRARTSEQAYSTGTRFSLSPQPRSVSPHTRFHPLPRTGPANRTKCGGLTLGSTTPPRPLEASGADRPRRPGQGGQAWASVPVPLRPSVRGGSKLRHSFVRKDAPQEPALRRFLSSTASQQPAKEYPHGSKHPALLKSQLRMGSLGCDLQFPDIQDGTPSPRSWRLVNTALFHSSGASLGQRCLTPEQTSPHTTTPGGNPT